MREPRRFDGLANPFRHWRAPQHRYSATQPQLFATVTRQQVRWPADYRPNRRDHLPEALVAGEVAVHVVIELKW